MRRASYADAWAVDADAEAAFHMVGRQRAATAFALAIALAGVAAAGLLLLPWLGTLDLLRRAFG